MSAEIHSSLVNMAQREIVELPGDAPVVVHCLSGSLWITEYRNGRDFVLGAGQTAEFDGRRRVVIQGLRPSTLRVLRADAHRARPQRLWRALAQWPGRMSAAN